MVDSCSCCQDLLFHLYNSADDELTIFFLFSAENRIWYFMQIVSNGDNLHEISNPVFWKKKKKIKMSSAENFTQF